MRILVLEDMPERISAFKQKFIGKNVDFTDNPNEAKDLLIKNKYDAIFLDHDLKPEHYGMVRGNDDETGYSVAKFLTDRPDISRNADIYIHSLSESGSDRMFRKLKETRQKVIKKTFAWKK